MPGRLIETDPLFYLQWLLDDFAGRKNVLAPEVVAEYQRCFDKEMIRATNEEFRAAASIDLEHDRADEKKKIVCPLLVLWSASGMWAKYDILKIWRKRAKDVRGTAFDGGHFVPEEERQRTADELIRFLSQAC